MQALAARHLTHDAGDAVRRLGQRLNLSWIRIEIALLIGALIMAG